MTEAITLLLMISPGLFILFRKPIVIAVYRYFGRNVERSYVKSGWLDVSAILALAAALNALLTNWMAVEEPGRNGMLVLEALLVLGFLVCAGVGLVRESVKRS